MNELKQKMASHRASNKYIGVHVIADFWGCRYEDSGKELLKLITEAARLARAEVLSSSVHEFEPAGTTAILLLGESHISIHTWPEYEYIAIDVFTCGHEMRPEFAIRYLEEQLKPAKTEVQVIDRGEK